MLQQRLPSQQPVSRNETLGDLRFRNLLSREDWLALPEAVRRRFSKRLGPGDTVVYVGEVVETEITPLGQLFGHLARLIGGPLPTCRDAHVPAVVTVTEDARSGGQNWSRLYARRRDFPQLIQSSKQFAGTTGLEEYVGHGVGMALNVRVANAALVFESAAYFVRVGRRRFTLPRWLTPGRIIVTHTELGGGQFAFRLDVVHPWFGPIIGQIARFREAKP
jgi:hypothetical protein